MGKDLDYLRHLYVEKKEKRNVSWCFLKSFEHYKVWHSVAWLFFKDIFIRHKEGMICMQRSQYGYIYCRYDRKCKEFQTVIVLFSIQYLQFNYNANKKSYLLSQVIFMTNMDFVEKWKINYLNTSISNMNPKVKNQLFEHFNFQHESKE